MWDKVCQLRQASKAKPIKRYRRHGLVDTQGLLLAVVVTPASVQDRDGARLLLSRLGGACKQLRLIWVDGGYRGQLLDWVAAHCRFRLRVVLRPEEQKRFAVLPWRWVVERAFALFNHHRRLSKDHERQAATARRWCASS